MKKFKEFVAEAKTAKVDVSPIIKKHAVAAGLSHYSHGGSAHGYFKKGGVDKLDHPALHKELKGAGFSHQEMKNTDYTYHGYHRSGAYSDERVNVRIDNKTKKHDHIEHSHHTDRS